MLTRAGFAAFTMLITTAAYAQPQENLASLAQTDPNRFVSEVQQALSASGNYTGEVNGTLNRSTIIAIYDACRAADVLDQCRTGPLSEIGAEAIVTAISAPSAQSAAASETSAVPAVDAVALAVEWRPDASSNGINVSVAQNDTGVAAAVTGEAIKTDWTNIISLRDFPSEPGETWIFFLTASAELTDGATATARIAAYGESEKYLGELTAGTQIESASSEFFVSGTTPEGTVSVRPYIQLRYQAGSSVDDVIQVTRAEVAQGT